MISITGEHVWPRREQDQLQAPSFYSVGVGLARQPRWGGQTHRWYSVLAHTLHVADLVAHDLRAYALLHDAAEAFLGDTPSTWKTDAHRADEADILERLHIPLGLAWPLPPEIHTAIKAADETARAAEAHALGFYDPDTYWPEPIQHDEEIVRGLAAQCRHWVIDPDVPGKMYDTHMLAALPAARHRETTNAYA